MGFWLFILALCLLPLERLILPFGLRLADLALTLLTLYGLVKAWRTRQHLRFPLLLPMWLLLLSSLLATLVGLAHPDSIVAIVQEIYLFAWFMALTNILTALPWPDQDRLMRIWSIVACLESVTTIMGMLRIGPSMFYTLPYRDQNFRQGLVRGLGTYINPNAAAVYLSVSFFIALATGWPLVVRLIVGGWIFAGIFATGSNGALFSTLGCFALLIAVHTTVRSRRDLYLLAAIAGIGAGAAAVALFIVGFSPSLLSGLGLQERGQLLFNTMGRFSHSLDTRFGLIEWAFGVYMRHPLGIGPNSFSTIMASLHNDYVAFWFERGPLGILGWLWMIGATLLTASRAISIRLDDGRARTNVRRTNVRAKTAGDSQSLRTSVRRLSAIAAIPSGQGGGDKLHRWSVLALGAGFLACALNAFSHEISHMRQLWMMMAFLFALSYGMYPQTHGCCGSKHPIDPRNQVLAT